MPTFILMTKLSAELAKDTQKRVKLGRRWKQAIQKNCPEVKFLHHFALLGPYDFMDIYEAPDEETAYKVSIITQKQGALQTETWTAMPYSRFLEFSEHAECE